MDAGALPPCARTFPRELMHAAVPRVKIDLRLSICDCSVSSETGRRVYPLPRTMHLREGEAKGMKRLWVLLILGVSPASAADLAPALKLYQHTDYRSSLKLLTADPSPDAENYALMGKNLYMLGEYKKATEAFQKADALQPNRSEYVHWLGRTYGRRAETGNPLLASGNANKARQYFERAVELDPKNDEALNDLFDYYLQAPGFLGGGVDKAEALARKIEAISPAEYYFAQAQLSDKKKQYDKAEEQLRRAMALAPRQAGRVIDLAKYLAKRGRYQESDATFQQADKLAPGSPKVMFEKAQSFIQTKRNLDQARVLLEKYLRSDLRPDDPSKDEARKLLKQVSAGA